VLQASSESRISFLDRTTGDPLRTAPLDTRGTPPNGACLATNDETVFAGLTFWPPQQGSQEFSSIITGVWTDTGGVPRRSGDVAGSGSA